jgi:hypothetical protein
VVNLRDPEAPCQEPEEPALPYTPSNTGRRARVGYLGFDGVGFNDLWPLFAGIILSIALALKFFIGEGADGRSGFARTAIAAAPFAAGFGYLRLPRRAGPPISRGPVGDRALPAARFHRPAAASLPIIPRVRVDATAARPGPARRRSCATRWSAKGRARGNP